MRSAEKTGLIGRLCNQVAPYTPYCIISAFAFSRSSVLMIQSRVDQVTLGLLDFISAR